MAEKIAKDSYIDSNGELLLFIIKFFKGFQLRKDNILSGKKKGLFDEVHNFFEFFLIFNVGEMAAGKRIEAAPGILCYLSYILKI